MAALGRNVLQALLTMQSALNRVLVGLSKSDLSTIFCTFLEPTIQQACQHYTAIGQVFGGEKVCRQWTSATPWKPSRIIFPKVSFIIPIFVNHQILPLSITTGFFGTGINTFAFRNVLPALELVCLKHSEPIWLHRLAVFFTENTPKQAGQHSPLTAIVFTSHCGTFSPLLHEA